MSPTAETLIHEIRKAPDHVVNEVYDFLMFIKNRSKVTTEGNENLLILAESSWAEDWNSREEDGAWRNL